MSKAKRILTAPVTLPLWLAVLMAACLLISSLIGDIQRWGITGILVFAAFALTGWGIGYLSTRHKA
jgi:hypothetical protein